jgi:hypothetical protein
MGLTAEQLPELADPALAPLLWHVEFMYGGIIAFLGQFGNSAPPLFTCNDFLALL